MSTGILPSLSSFIEHVKKNRLRYGEYTTIASSSSSSYPSPSSTTFPAQSTFIVPYPYGATQTQLSSYLVKFSVAGCPRKSSASVKRPRKPRLPPEAPPLSKRKNSHVRWIKESYPNDDINKLTAHSLEVVRFFTRVLTDAREHADISEIYEQTTAEDFRALVFKRQMSVARKELVCDLYVNYYVRVPGAKAAWCLRPHVDAIEFKERLLEYAAYASCARGRPPKHERPIERGGDDDSDDDSEDDDIPDLALPVADDEGDFKVFAHFCGQCHQGFSTKARLDAHLVKKLHGENTPPPRATSSAIKESGRVKRARRK